MDGVNMDEDQTPPAEDELVQVFEQGVFIAWVFKSQEPYTPEALRDIAS